MKTYNQLREEIDSVKKQNTKIIKFFKKVAKVNPLSIENSFADIPGKKGRDIIDVITFTETITPKAIKELEKSVGLKLVRIIPNSGQVIFTLTRDDIKI